MLRRWLVVGVGALAMAAGCGQTSDGSEPYSGADVVLIVPAETGETTDTVARAVAPCLADRLAADIEVRNLPGDNGVRGNRALADAEPDGRTLMISSVSPAAVTPLLLPERPYRADDFTFVGVVRSAPVVLFTAADSPVDSAEKLLAAAKAGGPPVTVANRGDETVEGFTLWHLNFLGETGLESAPVGSDEELLSGVVAGDHAAGLATLTPELLAAVRSGEVRLLASGGHVRPGYLPEVPVLYDLVGGVTADATPDLVIDTVLSAPHYIGDAKYKALSSALGKCLDTEQVQRAIGTEFMPEEQLGGGELTSRYRDLTRAVQLGLNMAEIEGR